MRYAHIKDGICINVIEIENEKMFKKIKKVLCKNGEELIDENIKIGSKFDGKIWVDNKKQITTKEIDAMVVEKIRERYSINDECKILRMGIANKKNTLFKEYNEYVEKCCAWGQKEKERLGEKADEL